MAKMRKMPTMPTMALRNTLNTLAAAIATIGLLLAIAGPVWADVINTYNTTSPALVTKTSFFTNASTVNVEVQYSAASGPIKNASVEQLGNPLNKVNFTVYDNGTGPGDIAGDSKYTGSFTLLSGASLTNDTLDRLGLGEGQNATITAESNAAAATIQADFTAPTFTIVQPTAGFYGPVIPIHVNVTDSGSSVILANYTVNGTNGTTSAALSCATLSTTVSNCTGTVTTSSVVLGNYTLYVTAQDKAGNIGSATLSSLQIKNLKPSISISFSHPTNALWHVAPSDGFTVFGNVTDSTGALISATLNSTLTLPGVSTQTQSVSYPGTGSFSLVWNFTGAVTGDGIIALTATDSQGNNVTITQPVYVTKLIKDLTLRLASDSVIWNEQDSPIFVVTATDSAGAPVYRANVTFEFGGINVSNLTNTAGQFSQNISVPKGKLRQYFASVYAYSQLNPSNLVKNASALRLRVEYINIGLNFTSPLVVNETNFFTGDAAESFGNGSALFERGSVQYLTYLEDNTSKALQGWTALKQDSANRFNFSFKPTLDQRHFFMINASAPFFNTDDNKTYTVHSSEVFFANTYTTLFEVKGDFALRLAAPQLIALQQNSSIEQNITLTNIGVLTITSIRFDVRTDAPWSPFVITPAVPADISSGTSLPLKFRFRSPENTSLAPIKTYRVNITALSREGARGTASILLRLEPDAVLRSQIEADLKRYASNVSRLEAALGSLAQTNTTEANLARSKLKSAKESLTAALNSTAHNDYYTAYFHRQDLAVRLEAAEVVAAPAVQAYEKGVATRNLIVIIVIAVTMIAVTIYYLWLPPKGMAPSGLPAVSKG